MMELEELDLKKQAAAEEMEKAVRRVQVAIARRKAVAGRLADLEKERISVLDEDHLAAAEVQKAEQALLELGREINL